jgi:hypothetical protein
MAPSLKVISVLRYEPRSGTVPAPLDYALHFRPWSALWIQTR